MKLTKTLLLAAALSWLCCSGIAAAQVAWRSVPRPPVGLVDHPIERGHEIGVFVSQRKCDFHGRSPFLNIVLFPS